MVAQVRRIKESSREQDARRVKVLQEYGDKLKAHDETLKEYGDKLKAHDDKLKAHDETLNAMPRPPSPPMGARASPSCRK